MYRAVAMYPAMSPFHTAPNGFVSTALTGENLRLIHGIQRITIRLKDKLP
jgi:hypothetical protein